MRLQGKRVLIVAGNLEALGDVLGGLTHRLGRVALGEPGVDESPTNRAVD